MRKKSGVLKIILAVFIVMAVFAPCLFSADCNVDWGTTHQSIRGFGASDAWAGSTLSDTNADILFRTDGSNIGLSMFRIRIPDSNGGEVPSIQKAVARNPDMIVWGAPWTPQNTAWKSTGSLNSGCLISTYYQAYANYLTKYVKDLSTNNGINLYALSMQNEPDWDTSGGYEMCTWTAEQMHQFVKNNLGPALQSSNPTCKLMMPEAFGGSLALSDPTLNDAAAAQYVGVIGEHSYGLAGDEPHTPYAYPLAVSLGKEYWETEYYNNHLSAYDATMTEGLKTAREIHNCLTIAEFNAYHYWWFVTDDTSDTAGLIPTACGSAACVPKYTYCFGNFSKFIRPGYTRIDTTLNPSTGVYVSAYKNSANGDFAIVAINTNGTGTSQRFVLTGGMNPTTVTPWLTDGGNSLIQQGNAAIAGGAFTYTLPASSVITFIGNSGTVPTTPTFTPTLTPIPCSIVLDDCEDGNNTNSMGGSWYNYVSNTSTILPSPFVMTAPGMTGSANYCASMTGNIATGAYGGMGCNLNSGGTGVDLTGYSGVEFYAKGTGSYWFQLTQSTITGSYFGYAVTVASTTTWTKFTINFPADLTQRYGGPGTLTLNAIIALQWANNANGAMDLQVDNIKFLQSCGTATNTPNVTATRTQTLTPTFTRTTTATYTRTPSATYTRTVTPSYTGTASFTQTRTNTTTPVFTNTFTRTFTPTPTYTPTRTLTYTATSTFTFTNTVPGSPTFTPTRTATPTSSRTASQTYTGTPTYTFTNTAPGTPSFTPTRTATHTYTRTATVTPTYTSTNTVPGSPTFTHTRTATQTATFTPSYTQTRSATPTYTYTATPTPTATPTLTRTWTPSLTMTPFFTGTRTPTPTASISPTHSVSPTFTQFAGSPTDTPTYTVTFTATRSFTATSTPTISVTASATNTRTQTPSNTGTFTPPSTATYTATNTAVPPTNTFTGTNTPVPQTPTFTVTNTVAPPTPSYTNTRTSSATQTLTAPASPTIQVSNTVTPTLTELPSHTITPTETVFAGSPTDTGTATRTPSVTMTGTELPSGTATPEDTATYTETVVPTPSETVSPTYTSTDVDTQTATPTGQVPSRTFTVTPADSGTPVNTQTRTCTTVPSATGTPASSVTVTQQDTVTLTFTLTSTAISTGTPTFTLTGTAVSTAVDTQLPTPVFTETPYMTETDTPVIAPSFTETAGLPATATDTPVVTATPTQGITVKAPWPNPYKPGGPDLNVGFYLSSASSAVKFFMYTSGFRLVRSVEWGALPAGYNHGAVNSGYLRTLSNGVYFYVVESRSAGNAVTRSKPEKIIIIN